MTGASSIHGLIAVMVAVVTLSPTANAAPLDAGSCEVARVEQGQLDTDGVRADVERGADWGRSNLAPERLRLVARWIELEEQILFRCPRPKPPPESAATAALDSQTAPPGTETADKANAGEAAAGGKPKTKKNATKKSGKKPDAKTPGEPGATIGVPVDGEVKKPTKKAAADKPAVKKQKPVDAYSPAEPAVPGIPDGQHLTPGSPAPDDSYRPPLPP